MKVQMSGAMLEALKATSEMPDNLIRCVALAQASGAGSFTIGMNEDEAMAMTEMCQWYIKKDPVTGKLTPKGELFDRIVRAIYQAQDA